MCLIWSYASQLSQSFFTCRISDLILSLLYDFSSASIFNLDLASANGVLPYLSTDLRSVPEIKAYIYP